MMNLASLKATSGSNGPSDVRTLETAVIHFLCYTMNTWLEDIVKANVWSKPKHKGSLSHVGTDHSAGTYDGQLLISQILHNKMYYLFIRFFQFHAKVTISVDNCSSAEYFHCKSSAIAAILYDDLLIFFAQICILSLVRRLQARRVCSPRCIRPESPVSRKGRKVPSQSCP